MAIHSSILAWRIPWTEEPEGLQSVGWQRAWNDCNDSARAQGGDLFSIGTDCPSHLILICHPVWWFLIDR